MRKSGYGQKNFFKKSQGGVSWKIFKKWKFGNFSWYPPLWIFQKKILAIARFSHLSRVIPWCIWGHIMVFLSLVHRCLAKISNYGLCNLLKNWSGIIFLHSLFSTTLFDFRCCLYKHRWSAALAILRSIISSIFILSISGFFWMIKTSCWWLLFLEFRDALW